MNCGYCFYRVLAEGHESSRFMTAKTVSALQEQILSDLSDGDSVRFAFQGGEPTLCGVDFFRDFIRHWEQSIAGHHIRVSTSYALQTNGLLLDDDFCRFLAKNHFLVGLSLDGDRAEHDKNRPDIKGEGTHRRVMEAMRRLKKHGADYNILWVLTEETARHPAAVWKFLCANDIRYVQFIPCLNPGKPEELQDHSDTAYPDALTPERFSSFYSGLLPLWAEALSRGEYRSVKFFDDIFNLLLYRNVTACGLTGSCAIQMIVEADGSVYPCDFYAEDGWKLGNLTQNSPDVLMNGETAKKFLTRKKPVPALCTACKWQKLCGSGCPRLAPNMCVNPTSGFCGYRTFLDQNKDQINKIAAYLYSGHK
ncbi:MAG: SPASM domain-containing protein [Clostridia bacterium]|nr:SPASM domain-containing protein [Clostridia bacterium]